MSQAAVRKFEEAQTPTTSATQKRSSLVLVVLAFASIYLIWGSTYLAISYAIQTLPPFLMAATRFLIGGGVLFSWAVFNGAARPTASQWRNALIVGALLLLCGNGGVTWAEKYIASGLAALIVATEPLWIVILNWAITHRRPDHRVLLGVFIGIGGVALLVSGGFRSGGAGTWMQLIGLAVVLAASFAWAAGSVYSNRQPSRASTFTTSGMQMLAGGTLLLLVGLLVGDFKQLNFAHTSWLSMGALAYLIIFGSIVAFTAYSWLLRNVSTTLVATYAYVNPVVAVFLGWLIAHEPVTTSMLVAAVIIVGSVVLITTFGREGAKETGEEQESECSSHPCA
jgi:drug/metabolite transporter (DMT)-like permease